jgi:hypothetical protein
MPPPFFIVGSARSGTTFLRLTLNAHPDVAVPPESRFITELHTSGDEVDVEAFLQRLAAHKRFEAWGLPISAVRTELDGTQRASYASAISAVYRAYAKSQGKSRWGDKTPRYVEHIPEIDRLFPDARFIHLIRDGRDVALSYGDVDFGPKNVARAARLWAARVEAGVRDGRALGDRYLEVHYADLTDDTEGTLKDICALIDLDFDPVMLDPDATRKGALDRSQRYNPHVREGAKRHVRSWETDMPPDHEEIFEAIAGDVLSSLGFERRHPSPSLWARLKAALALKGAPFGTLRSTRK